MRFRLYITVCLFFACVQIFDEQCFSNAQATTNEKPNQTTVKRRTKNRSENQLMEQITQIRKTLLALLSYKIGRMQMMPMYSPTNSFTSPMTPPFSPFLPPPRPYIAQAIIAPPPSPPGTAWFAQAGVLMPGGPPGAQPPLLRPLAAVSPSFLQPAVSASTLGAAPKPPSVAAVVPGLQQPLAPAGIPSTSGVLPVAPLQASQSNIPQPLPVAISGPSGSPLGQALGEIPASLPGLTSGQSLGALTTAQPASAVTQPLGGIPASQPGLTSGQSLGALPTAQPGSAVTQPLGPIPAPQVDTSSGPASGEGASIQQTPSLISPTGVVQPPVQTEMPSSTGPLETTQTNDQVLPTASTTQNTSVTDETASGTPLTQQSDEQLEAPSQSGPAEPPKALAPSPADSTTQIEGPTETEQAPSSQFEERTKPLVV